MNKVDERKINKAINESFQKFEDFTEGIKGKSLVIDSKCCLSNSVINCNVVQLFEKALNGKGRGIKLIDTDSIKCNR
jgi:hypothetical protein